MKERYQSKVAVFLILTREIKDLELVSLIHPYQDDYINVFFTTHKYSGIPKIMEPNKCDDLQWFNINDLPENTIVRIRNVIRNIKKGILYDDDEFSYYNNSEK